MYSEQISCTKECAHEEKMKWLHVSAVKTKQGESVYDLLLELDFLNET